MGSSAVLLLITTTCLFARVLSAQHPGERLMFRLGCGNCHDGMAARDSLRELAPDLTFAGERYAPAYLFAYLQNPVRVRQHISPARMPDFHLDEREALALTLYLTATMAATGPAFREVDSILATGTAVISTSPPELIREVGCLQCHTLNGHGHAKAVALEEIGYRLQRPWVERFLVAPHLYGVSENIMPSPFFVPDKTTRRLEPVEQFPVAKVKAIAAHLDGLQRNRRRELQAQFEKIRRAHPEITAGTGARIFLALNCLACHKKTGASAPWRTNAPDLRLETTRARSDWLIGYLQQPQPIRPFGYFIGSGSRMPDFQLAPDEAQQISGFLLQSAGKLPPSRITHRKLSRFSMNKARALLEQKLPCLGCHSLGKSGGRIGPDLSSIAARRQPDYIFRIIEDPVRTIGHDSMPLIAMPPSWRELISNYLAQQNEAPASEERLSLVDHPPYFYQKETGAAKLYLQHCAACHGLQGNGDGYNATFLPVRPTRHADAEYMHTRPDDTLFDGVFVGGYILNKSQFMPGFGQTLSREQIWELVAHMRTLCACEQPDWAADNK